MDRAGRMFSYQAFACDERTLWPEACLPKNLDGFWLDGILKAKLSELKSENDLCNAIIRYACSVLLRDFSEEPDPLHEDLYLQELMLEKLERINVKAGVSNTGFAYVPAELDDIFTGPHYNDDHMTMLLKMVAGAFEWEQRQDEALQMEILH